MNAEAFEFGVGPKAFQLVQRVGILDHEFGDSRAAERFEMGSAAQSLADIVGHGTHVRARSHAGAKAGTIVFERKGFELLDLDLHWLKPDFLLSASKLV